MAAQTHGLTPDALATAWTGVRVPACRTDPARSMAPPGGQRCIWRGRTAATWDAAEVVGTRLPDRRIGHVVWARLTRDSVGALAVRDSVHAALVARGVSVHECQWGARLWLAPDFAALFSLGARDRAKGGWRMSIQVVDDPSAVPAFMCRGVPLTPRTGQTRRRIDS
jgi:hypothetical protein